MEERTIEEAFFPDGLETKPVPELGEGAQGQKSQTQGQEPGQAEHDHTLDLDWHGKEPDENLEQLVCDAINDLGLPKEKAQGYLDHILEVQAKEAAIEEKWEREINEDPEIGGFHRPETCCRATDLIEKFGGPEAVQAISITGLSNNPALVRMAVKLHKALFPDFDYRARIKGAQGTKSQEAKQPVSPGGPRTVAEAFFPDGWESKRGNQ